MIGLLTSILSVFEDLGAYVLYGVETAINAVFAAFGAAVDAAVGLLPSLPATFAPPTIVGWLNWFFPVVAYVSVATSLVASYATFLAVRWLFRKAGIL
jgi:hypothetical protein